MGAAATSARTAAARRRTIAGWLDVTEVIHYSLIRTIYKDRPDIGQQLMNLLLLAQDIGRDLGWTFALEYIEAVRAKFYHSPGDASGRHCLLIDSKYDMGKEDVQVLLRLQLHRNGGPPGKENHPGNTNRAELGDGKARKNTETCRGWNNGTCARKAADCKYVHRCSTCSSTEHAAPNCLGHGRPGGQAVPAATAASSSTSRNT